jgi:hypothetical protein
MLVQFHLSLALRIMVGGAVVSLLVGCSTLRYGGAPEPSFDIKTDLQQLSQEFAPSNSITEFYKAPSKDARNKFIVGRLTLINLRYIQFIRNLTCERQLLDSATAMLSLGLNLAGATVPAAGTKTILAAIASGVTGSKEVIDKNYYFEKTLPALVGQMNAERKKALIPLLEGMQASLEDYPFAQAVTDLHNYYSAGTFAGAIQAIQAEAGAMEKRQDEIIARLVPLTRAQIDAKAVLTKAIGLLKESDLGKIRAAIKILDPQVTPAASFKDALAQLQGYVRGARTPDRIAVVTLAFKQAGIFLPE